MQTPVILLSCIVEYIAVEAPKECPIIDISDRSIEIFFVNSFYILS